MNNVKKIYKKINFIFLGFALFFVGFIISNKDGNDLSLVEKAQADVAPVFTPAQIAQWIGRGGDASDGPADGPA